MDQIESAVVDFEVQRRTWGVRTDCPNGTAQGYSLPFIWKGTLVEALKLWNEHKDRLLYIVVENVLRVQLHAVAVKLDAEHVLFEWNDKEPEIWQRQMYRKPENLRKIVVGPGGYELLWGYAFVRCVPSEYTSQWRFDDIYDVIIHSDVDEVTFTVREDGKLIVW
jgi:hypothetical protein